MRRSSVFFLLSSIVVTLSSLAQAAPDMRACVTRLESDTAEQIGVAREEEGRPVPQLSCKIQVTNETDGEANGPCEKIIKFKAICLPQVIETVEAPIEQEGGACCPG